MQQKEAVNNAPTDALSRLRELSTVVADTGEIQAIEQFRPTDATTNPSLVLAAAQLPAYAHLVADAVAHARTQNGDRNVRAANAVDRLMTLFGREITAIIPRYVSTEVDAHLSFDTESTIAKGRRLIELYEQLGVQRERILIKIASTWEGIRAAGVLEAEGIRCNMTLIFSLAQAAACFDSGVTLISPFVGRITDWHKARDGVDGYTSAQDPGVLSVRRIYAYAKTHAYPTLVMGASFRNTGQILALAGCDLLTISPQLLTELGAMQVSVPRALHAGAGDTPARLASGEAGWRWRMASDAMASEKLNEGIRKFAADQAKLQGLIAAQLG